MAWLPILTPKGQPNRCSFIIHSFHEEIQLHYFCLRRTRIRMLQLSSVPFVVKIQLTVTGFGSESSSGHILNRGCPNSCVLESATERRVLLAKLGPFFSLRTRFHLVSVWEAKIIAPDFHCGLMNHRSTKAEEKSQKHLSQLPQCYFQTHHFLAATCPLGYMNEHCPGNRIKRKWCESTPVTRACKRNKGREGPQSQACTVMSD